MKKTLIGLVITMFSFASASAEIGVNIGISGNAALFAATATELDTGTHGTTTDGDEKDSESDFLGAAYGSIFVEGEMGPILVGIDFVPSSLDTETASTVIDDKTTTDTATAKTNTVKVSFDDLTTAYVGLKIMDNAYIKVGAVSVDLVTKESLGTGGSYGDTSLDGSMVGVGVGHTMDNGIFLRAEATYMEFDSVSLTSTSGSQKITLDSLDGVSGKVSIGKSF
tara:strand:+ start:710 stop:1381 length:672 start_codon:yes stop_codon:yes gene_type:complete